MASSELLELCERALERAARGGADQAEAYAERGREATVRVRDGEVEDLSEATAKGLGLRVFRDGRLGFAYTSDFSPAGLDRLVESALALARVSAVDRDNQLPTGADLAGRHGELEGLHDPRVASLSTDWKIAAAREAERAARAGDPRISGFDSSGAGDSATEVAIASSEGLRDFYRATNVVVWTSPVARDDRGGLQTSFWHDQKRFLADLEDPASIGRTAARRTVRMLGAKKAPTQRCPVVFDPQMAASFLSGLAATVNAELVVKGASLLADRLGQSIASPLFTLVDDGLLPRGLGTRPFDGEGVPTRRTAVFEAGVLKTFLHDAYTARRTRSRTTGNARRGYASLPSVGTANFYLENGATPAAELIRGVKSGLYVTAMLGRGVNPVTGEFSRGANGLWIRDGELAEPVQEVTVSGSLLAMLQGIDAVGDDLEFRGAVASPSIRFAELTVSGG
jgi:PmbA protein